MTHRIPEDSPSRTSISYLESEYSTKREKLIKQISPNFVSDAPFLFMDRRILSSALSKIELFKRIQQVQGVIIECGVYKGNSLSLWIHLSSILEPYAFTRKVIGFDTFTGFPRLSEKDPEEVKSGQLRDTNLQLIEEMLEINEMNRPISNIRKFELVVGDAVMTIPEYVASKKSLTCALLYLDFDLYEPTKIALEQLYPLIPKGGIIAFDQLAQEKWLGEHMAFSEIIGIGNVELRKFSHDPHLTYFVKE